MPTGICASFDEHCWPTLLPPDDVQEANVALFKHHAARAGAKIADGELHRGLQAVISKVSCPDAPTVVVFNPLAHPRTDLARVPLGPAGRSRRSAVTRRQPQRGKPSHVSVRVSTWCSSPATFQPSGYTTYTVRRGSASPLSGMLKVDGTAMENRFYRVTFDATTGTIASLFDKELGRELVDKAAPHGLGQFIYDHRVKRTSTDGFQASPIKAKLTTSQPGPVFVSMRVETAEPRSGAEICQIITLYRDVKRVDIANELRNVRVMWEDERKFRGQPGKAKTRFRNGTSRYEDNVFPRVPVPRSRSNDPRRIRHRHRSSLRRPDAPGLARLPDDPTASRLQQRRLRHYLDDP